MMAFIFFSFSETMPCIGLYEKANGLLNHSLLDSSVNVAGVA